MASTWAQMRLEVEMKVPKLRADASWPSRFHSRPVVHTRLRHPPSPVSTLQAHAPPQPSALCAPIRWQWQVWQGVGRLVGVLLDAATCLCARTLWAHMPIGTVGSRGLVGLLLHTVCFRLLLHAHSRLWEGLQPLVGVVLHAVRKD